VKRTLFAFAVGVAVASAEAADAVPLPKVVRGEMAAPVSVTTNEAGHAVVDFGKHQFGWLEVDVPRAGTYAFAWGELLDEKGGVQTNAFYTKEQGRIRCAVTRGTFEKTGRQRIPYLKGNGSAFHPEPLPGFGVVMPFRWLEVVDAPFAITKDNVRQVPVYHPYDMNESSFSCDDEALNRVYEFCKHTIRATTYTGKFIDGDRERLPYEADSYITMLGTYAITSDQALTRMMTDYLATHSTWPTEWKQFFVRMVYEDWMHSGRTDLVRKHYALMRDMKAWRQLRRPDGLLVTPCEKAQPSPDGGFYRDLADWAKCYRDGFVFTPVNAIINALHYRNLRELALMARAIGETADAETFEREAETTFAGYQAAFYDAAQKRYRDGIGTDHATVQANAMALACGVVPPDRVAGAGEYVAGKGFSCSTYMAQFVLEALFAAGRDWDALRLMTGAGPRSWLGMMAQGATITPEFWDLTMAERGRVPDMNHAWSTAPLNMISRHVLGVTPSVPGFASVRIAPRPGSLKRVSARVPTPRGTVEESLTFVGGDVRGTVRLPAGMTGTFVWKTGRVALREGVTSIDL